MEGRDAVSDFWTMERIDRLFVMVKEGFTFLQIGAEIGCSRNAAIGKYNRTRVSRGIHTRVPRNKVIALKREERISRELVRNTAPKRVYNRKQREPDVPNDGIGFLLPALPVPVPMASAGISIVDVVGCRYPVADDVELVGGKAFCNEALDGHRMYCAAHTKVVFSVPTKSSGGMKHRKIPTSVLRAGGF